MRSDTVPQPLAIETQAVTKSFGHHHALAGIDLRVKHGEFVVIFGPNGAGKTTLIKVLATIMNPSSGLVMIDGMSTRDHAEKVRSRIGLVTHQAFLYSSLTAYENLEFYSRMYDVPKRGERIREVVALMGMTPRLHDRMGTLSRGMQQRLSIARSLLHKPAIMLLDEPEMGLDQQAVSMLWEGVQGEEKRTVILTTHNLERGLELSDRLVILDQGKIVYEGLSQMLDITGLKEVYHHGGEAEA